MRSTRRFHRNYRVVAAAAAFGAAAIWPTWVRPAAADVIYINTSAGYIYDASTGFLSFNNFGGVNFTTSSSGGVTTFTFYGNLNLSSDYVIGQGSNAASLVALNNANVNNSTFVFSASNNTAGPGGGLGGSAGGGGGGGGGGSWSGFSWSAAGGAVSDGAGGSSGSISASYFSAGSGGTGSSGSNGQAGVNNGQVGGGGGTSGERGGSGGGAGSTGSGGSGGGGGSFGVFGGTDGQSGGTGQGGGTGGTGGGASGSGGNAGGATNNFSGLVLTGGAGGGGGGGGAGGGGGGSGGVGGPGGGGGAGGGSIFDGPGGQGGNGGSPGIPGGGGSGAVGGSGGYGGGGGGALEISALGQINITSTGLYADGGAAVGGAGPFGGNGGAAGSGGNSGGGGGGGAGNGGNGGTSGAGGRGGTGGSSSAGGGGGGGSGGTILLDGSAVFTNGSYVETEGGSSPVSGGGPGRFVVAANSSNPDQAGTAGAQVQVFNSSGPTDFNYYTGSNTPFVPDTAGGAESYGVSLDYNANNFASILSSAPANAKAALVRLSSIPGDPDLFPGYDFVAYINLTGTGYSNSPGTNIYNPLMGLNNVGWTYLANKGYSNSSPVQIGSLAPGQVYITTTPSGGSGSYFGYFDAAGSLRYINQTPTVADDVLFISGNHPFLDLQASADYGTVGGAINLNGHSGTLVATNTGGASFGSVEIDGIANPSAPLAILLDITDPLTPLSTIAADLTSEGYTVETNGTELADNPQFNLMVLFNDPAGSSDFFSFDFSDYGDVAVQQLAVTVPEPASLGALIGVGALLMMRRRRRAIA